MQKHLNEEQEEWVYLGLNTTDHGLLLDVNDAMWKCSSICFLPFVIFGGHCGGIFIFTSYEVGHFRVCAML